MTNPESIFSPDDRKRIAEAVHAAERSTSAELVPYVVGRSDSYPEAPWRAGTLLAALVLFALAGIWFSTNSWLSYGVVEVALYTAVAYAAGASLALLVPRLRLAFVSSHAVANRVDERAAMAFLHEEVFATRERTGILLFISLLERRVRVLGDSGINAKVRQQDWDGIVAELVRAMKRGAPAEGLIAAIGSCGALLAADGVQIRPDDTNELDDALRMHST